MKTQKFYILCSCLLLGAVACTAQKEPEAPVNKHLIHTLGLNTFNSLSDVHRIVIMKLKPKKPNGYEIDGEPAALSGENQAKLTALLTRDDSYIYDKTKKCLFIPEYAIQIQGETGLLILFSPSCQQLKFINGLSDNNVILDIDPSYDALLKIVKESRIQKT